MDLFRPSLHLMMLAGFTALLSACDGDSAGAAPRDGGASGRVDGGPEDGGPVPADGGAIGRDAGEGGDSGAGLACGDGVLDPGESCDDGNTRAGDGCSDRCGTEPGFVCVAPGQPCVRLVACGNGRLEADETCDDRNEIAGDGCSADCQVEPGWACPFAGTACRARACGDGFRVAFEACDDGNTRAGDGCSPECTLENGFKCPEPGEACVETVCGDGVTEGTEECDDANLEVGDGCTPFCAREPDCTDGVCVAVCGDEITFAPETCDDGNRLDDDGCSSDCQIEEGFTCQNQEVEPPPSVTLPIVLRDFLPACEDGVDSITTFPTDDQPGATPPYGLRDFQCFNTGLITGMVEDRLTDGRPVLRASAANPSQGPVDNVEDFRRWYVSDDDYNRSSAQPITLQSIAPGVYRFDSEAFFPFSHPLDGRAPEGFVAEGVEAGVRDDDGVTRNFFFTSEIRFWFRYEGFEELAFSGDDDVWVFINERLAVDIGGIHGRVDRSVRLAEASGQLGLTVGGIYEAVVFHAERHTTRSQYRLTLTGFNRAPSVCASTCGDGIVTRFEACDNGEDNGAEYNGCTDECLFSPYCGDGVVQPEFGEVCDGGGEPDAECAPDCRSDGERCGDGVVQPERGESCDDGNTEDGDGCSEFCTIEV